jgi:hypothetical protein
MKYLPSLHHGLLVLSLGLAVTPTWASDDCDAPVNRWQTREALRQWATAQGWQVQQLKIDDGCYEIRGTDAQGRGFKAKIDPETLKVLKMKQDDHQRARERDRGDGGAARHPPPAQPDGAAVPSPLSAPGTTPQGQTK